ncbi:sterol desaturase family protein [Brasilonema bromeliae]|uniref:Fatty acid hydroxylase family protein n=1 Tax=Brasilonema bromeliae SPC951 TaxID=385972 RepID=A0ABX1PD55_9CYAN|nr:sterol desaturase family protein [Brasilonema bromeliae]NMG21425.1 fatty acid hydroxylase family protein [Brasilonema bromeliae SPC951]
MEIEFYLKIAISSTIIQQIFYWPLHNIELNFLTQVLLYWLVGSVSFYSIGLFIEKVIKKNDTLREKLTARVKKVKKQPFPSFTAKGIIIGEIRSLIAALIILYLAPDVNRGNSLLLNLGWFLMRIIAADFCFYVTHWLFHRKFLRKIHLKHHEFADSSSFVAGHKSLTEYIIVTITDLLPIFIFGYDITQLCAWTIIGNAYNLEGHSSLSIFFVPSDFHDLHHTCFKGNYGIQGFWDRVFNTLNPPTKKSGIMFPVASLENITMKSSSNLD